MPDGRNDDDDDTIITDLSDTPRPKKLTHAKQDQLAAARIKALESRRKTQKAGLEARLHEVRLLLGELDPTHFESVERAIMSQERDLRRQQKELTLKLIELIKNESAKRTEENASIKRSIEKLVQALSLTRSKDAPPPSAVSKSSSRHSVVPLSEFKKRD